MSFQLMKERINISGSTAIEEMIRDGQRLLCEELENDSSYSPTMYFYDHITRRDVRPARLRIYGRDFSSLNGNYRKFLTTHDNPIKIGDYFHDKADNTYWLVYNAFNVNDIHYEGKLVQCNYLLRWQLSNGRIVERYANIVSASKYDVGEKGNKTIIISTNTYSILMGYCREGFELEGKRVFIDRNPHNPTKVFHITRHDDVIYNADGMGFNLSFMADKVEFNPKTDNQKMRICNYIDIPQRKLLFTPGLDTDSIAAVIDGKRSLTIGFSRTYTVDFIDKNHNKIDWQEIDFSWDISDAAVSDSVVSEVNDNTITLLVSDEDLIGSSFNLRLLIDGIVNTEIEINIAEGW